MNKRKILFTSIMITSLFLLASYVLEPAFSPSLRSKKFSSNGAIKAVGVGVYADVGCRSILSSIDWGMLEAGVNRVFTCYVRGEGNSASVLFLRTANWNPSSVSQFISLNWNYSGQSIAPNEVIEVTFTLSVSNSTSGITTFNFDTIISSATT
jgi:hypothetical protein